MGDGRLYQWLLAALQSHSHADHAFAAELAPSWFVVLKVLVLVYRWPLNASGAIPVCGRGTGSSAVQSLY